MEYFVVYRLEMKFRIYYLVFSFVVTVFTGYLYKEVLLFSIVEPMTEILSFFSWIFIFNQFIDLFSFLVYIVFIFSVFCILPLIIFHFCLFFIPGIYFREVYNYFFLLLLFFLNIFVCYRVLFNWLLPFSLQYFVFFFIGSGKNWLQYEYIPFLIEYGRLFFFFCGVVLVLFQFPVGLFFYLYKLPQVEKNVVMLRWKVFFLNILFATFFSPPDLWSQLVLFVLLSWLFEMVTFFLLMKKGCLYGRVA